MKALHGLKVFSLTSTMAIACLLAAPLTQTAQAKTGGETTTFENRESVSSVDRADRVILQAQSGNRQQIAERVILLHRQMVGPNTQISRHYLEAYVNCIEQNVCSWDDVRSHIAQTNQVENRGSGYEDRYEDHYEDRRRRSSRQTRYPRNDRYDSYEDDGEILQAQSGNRDRIEEQVIRLHREMLGRNARINRRDLRDYVNCIDRGRCDLDDIRQEIAYSDDAEEAIEDIYEEVLERDPDRGGMRTYQNRLADDWNIEEVREDIADSDEAENAINRIYREILGRNADRGGLRTYQRKLGEGWSLDKVRRDIADSDEARRRRGG